MLVHCYFKNASPHLHQSPTILQAARYKKMVRRWVLSVKMEYLATRWATNAWAPYEKRESTSHYAAPQFYTPPEYKTTIRSSYRSTGYTIPVR